MSAPSTCRHCHGTTFCGGHERNGTLWTSPACATCLVRSGLPAEGRLHKVVCSVCAGTGDSSERLRARLRTALLLFCGLLLFVLGLLAARSLPHPGERGDEAETAGQLAQPAPDRPRVTPESLRGRRIGRSRQPTRAQPGTPNSTRPPALCKHHPANSAAARS